MRTSIFTVLALFAFACGRNPAVSEVSDISFKANQTSVTLPIDKRFYEAIDLKDKAGTKTILLNGTSDKPGLFELRFTKDKVVFLFTPTKLVSTYPLDIMSRIKLDRVFRKIVEANFEYWLNRGSKGVVRVFNLKHSWQITFGDEYPSPRIKLEVWKKDPKVEWIYPQSIRVDVSDHL